MYVLLALVVVARLALVVKVAGVLHGDVVALLRLVDAIALLNDLLGDTHCVELSEPVCDNVRTGDES